MKICLVLCLVASVLAQARADDDIITEPRPGDEYVLVSSGQQTPLRNFETSHKIPEKHPQHRALRYEAPPHHKKTIKSGPKLASEGIVAIEEDKRVIQKKGHKIKAAESIEIDVPVSKLEEIKIKENVKDVDTNPKMAVALEAMSESGKLSGGAGTTTQRPVLTTGAPATQAFDYVPINFETIDDINSGLLSSNVRLETAASEQKQHSRIQIKKGPNGQDYEYEYIYYYYDEDEEGGKSKEKSSTAAPVHNAHDGPQKAETDNHIAQERSKSKYSSIDRSAAPASTAAPAPEADAAARPRQRGRNLTPAPVQEDIADDRLPSSTRFPPRGRTLAHEAEPAPRAAAAAEPADEAPAQTRTRTRAHIRRPSSELVDLDSFKTHSGDASNQYKDPPSRYSSESRSTTEAEPATPAAPVAPAAPAAPASAPREPHSLPAGVRIQEITDESKLPADYKTTTTYEHDTTEFTTMTAMEKVALDLYAYLAGESIDNEISPTSADLMSFDGTTTVADEAWTAETTTEEPTTTTTTTTTTTPAPTTTTTTTTAAPTRPSRFKLRPGARGRTSTTTTTTDAPLDSSTKARGRFSRPRAGARQSTTKAAQAPDASTPAPETSSKAAVSAVKPLAGRRGLFAGRTRPSFTTHAPAQDDASAAASTSATPAPAQPSHPRLHRPAAAVSAAEPSAEGDETTTASSRTIGRGRPGLRPLRPGPRLNLRPSPRLRGAVTPAPAAESEAPETAASEAPATEPDNAESSSSTTPEPARGVNKLRRRPISPSPKPRVAVTSAPRRPNPLLKRKTPSTEATTESKPAEETEASVSEEKATETAPPPAETTPAPPLRGLEALYARRRAAAAARPARRAHATR